MGTRQSPAHTRTVLSRRLAARRGVSWRGLIVALAVVAAISGVVYYLAPWNALQAKTISPLTQVAKQDVFTYAITAQGEVESSANVEVRCEVQARNGSGTAILEIVPEGTNVQPGDLLVRFDASALENERGQQRIVCNSSEALLIQAQNEYETALIAKQEYLEGTFKQEQELLETEIFVAEENLRRAEDYARYSERLYGQGYVTQLQLEADRFAVDKARKELETAKTKLDVLRRFTKEKMIKSLESDIAISKSKMESNRATYELDIDKLELIEDQIKKCTILAPAPGQVVYANEADRRGSSEFVIEAGAVIRERQAVIRLPDPEKMQVRAKINEARIDRIRPGMLVTIKLDAIRNVELEGIVRKVDEYPLPGSWFSASVKEYGTYIDILNPPAGIRPGLTAEVKIYIEQIQDALQVPLQAVFERGGQMYCIVQQGESLEPRQVAFRSNNEKFVVIDEGIQPGEQVLMQPTAYLDRVIDAMPAVSVTANEKIRDLPDLSQQVASREPTARDASAAEGGAGERPREAGGIPSAADMIKSQDQNGDGKLSEDEVAEQFRPGFSRMDTNSDGFIDAQELGAILAKARAAQGGGGGPPGGMAGGRGGVGQ